MEKRCARRGIQALLAASLASTALIAGCGDDDSFSPISRADADQDKELSSSSLESSSSSKKGGSEAAMTSSSSRASSSSRYSSSSSSHAKVKVDPLLKEKGEQFNPDIEYGTMTDPRDGKTYRTVEIRGQIWMAENLNYAGDAQGDSYCYNYDEELCELYGRLYTREAAFANELCHHYSTCPLSDSLSQGICPDGWHLPWVSEIDTLISYIGTDPKHWSSAKGWDHTLKADPGLDTYGLSFVASGQDSPSRFDDLDTAACMWLYSADQHYLVLNASSDKVFVHDYDLHVTNSVRCVKGEFKPYTSEDWEKSKPRLTKKGEQFNPDIDYGTMTDPRDGKTYRTVEVDGVTWMAENLNYAENNVGTAACFNDDELCELYGRLYSRDAAMNSPECAVDSSCELGDNPIQGICPEGWHIPAYSETQALVDLVDSTASLLMSAKGWGVEDSLYIIPGKDTYGLSFVGTGNYNAMGEFAIIGQRASIWAYKESKYMYYLAIWGKDNLAYNRFSYDYEVYHSVRCIKDAVVVGQ